MSKNSEEIMKKLTKFVEENRDENLDEEGIDNLVEQFISKYNSSLHQENTLFEPETADDYLELAEDAKSKKKKMEYLQKAIELEPDNLDALYAVAELNAKDPDDMREKLSILVKKGTVLMEKGGFFVIIPANFGWLLRHAPICVCDTHTCRR